MSVGRSEEYIPGYFGMIHTALNDKGVACVQVITIPEARLDKCASPSYPP